MSCPPGKILNPSTGRCVNRDGKIGKMILGIKTSPKKSSPQKSSNTEIRCVYNLSYENVGDLFALPYNYVSDNAMKFIDDLLKYSNASSIKVDEVDGTQLKFTFRSKEPLKSIKKRMDDVLTVYEPWYPESVGREVFYGGKVQLLEYV